MIGMSAKERRLTAKGLLAKTSGKDIERNHISPVDKVAIMEYLLSCPMDEVIGYNDNSMPAFVVECALLLINNELTAYTDNLIRYRQMAKEDNFMPK